MILMMMSIGVSKLNSSIFVVKMKDKIVEIKSELPGKGEPNRELSYCFRNMIFEKDGTYVFRFWVDDDVIGEKYLRVMRR